MKPKLYMFAISHYCEKARWALDYLQIDYEIVHVAPGVHASVARKLGASSSTLPILETDDEVIQGSAAIIDWADNATQSGRKLTPLDHREECLAIEKRLDDIVGVHTRRMFYSEALVEHSATVRPIFTKDLPFFQRALIRAAWPFIRRKMIEKMDLGLKQGEESRDIVDEQLRWLDTLLSDGRPFLVADQLSRADIAAAGLFARMASPREHPSFRFLNLPPRLSAQAEKWKDRPSLSWIRELYRQYR